MIMFRLHPESTKFKPFPHMLMGFGVRVMIFQPPQGKQCNSAAVLWVACVSPAPCSVVPMACNSDYKERRLAVTVSVVLHIFIMVCRDRAMTARRGEKVYRRTSRGDYS